MCKIIVVIVLFFVVGLVLVEGECDSCIVMSNFSYDYVEVCIGVSFMIFGVVMSCFVYFNVYVIGWIDLEFESDYDVVVGFGFYVLVNNWVDFTGEMLFCLVDDCKCFSVDTGMELNIGIC